jgi:4-hydroxybenzoate polyprenyltransferase
MVPNSGPGAPVGPRAYHGAVPNARPGALGRALSLLGACHPEPAGAVTLLTALLALAAGMGVVRTLVLTLAVAAGQLGVGWSNDYLDRQLDRRSGRADKPVATGAVAPGTIRAAAVAALVLSLPLSLAVSAGFAAVHLLAIVCALAYNAGLKARAVSVLPYAVAFGLLPVAVAQALVPAHWAPAWAVAAGALIGAGGHFTQALPDIPADRALGIRGLPQIVGQRASALAAATLLLAANVVIALAAETQAPLRAAQLALAVLLTVGIVAGALANRPRAAFRLTLAAAALAVLAFLVGGSGL